MERGGRGRRREGRKGGEMVLGLTYFQPPWLITATLRENILFGKPMDRRRYDETLFACALGKDLALLPSGDMTEIGEKVCLISFLSLLLLSSFFFLLSSFLFLLSSFFFLLSSFFFLLSSFFFFLF